MFISSFASTLTHVSFFFARNTYWWLFMSLLKTLIFPSCMFLSDILMMGTVLGKVELLRKDTDCHWRKSAWLSLRVLGSRGVWWAELNKKNKCISLSHAPAHVVRKTEWTSQGPRLWTKKWKQITLSEGIQVHSSACSTNVIIKKKNNDDTINEKDLPFVWLAAILILFSHNFTTYSIISSSG